MINVSKSKIRLRKKQRRKRQMCGNVTNISIKPEKQILQTEVSYHRINAFLLVLKTLQIIINYSVMTITSNLMKNVYKR